MSFKKKGSVVYRVILTICLLLCTVSEVVGEEHVCSTINVQNSVENFRALENCTVIEGQLHILLIDGATSREYEKYSFPQLVEITDYLLIYRVYGLRTLRNLFPNLAVIRGQKLFHSYALIAYETPDLETLGLISLTTIMRGAVRLQKNTKLCYIDTIDWSRIATAVDVKDHFLEENKDEQECVNFCPDNCPSSTVGDKTAKRCWTSDNCQKNIYCPNCGARGFCTDKGLCCSEFCVGGCTGPSPGECISCRNVTFKGQCEPECPPETYMFMSRRCLLDRECINTSRRAQHEHWKIIRFEKSPRKPGLCVEECPNGYSIDEKDATVCKKCNNYCPKECLGKTVDSIESAQDLKGCTKIKGPLEIQIRGGSNIALELERSLGMIQEVTSYIKIMRSYALLSLGFFKSLRVIHGNHLEYNFYSLIVMDNANLQELFPEEVLANLTMKKGIASFHFNRKLCYNKIKEFLNTIKVNFTDNDVSAMTNGDLIPCSVEKMTLNVEVIRFDYVILKWQKFKQADPRELLSYVINYREAKSKNVNIYQGRDACLDTVWKTRDVNPGDDNSDYQVELLYGLQPWTQYAVYIQTYTLQTAKRAANSDLLFFTTERYYPTSPRNVQVFAEEQGELHVKWDSPKKPNGPVNHYIVYWQLQELETGEFDRRDYCSNPIVMPKKKTINPQEEKNKYLNQTVDGECCECPKSKKNLEEQERQRLQQIDFENNLHDTIYTKRPRKYRPEGNKRSKRSIGLDEEDPSDKYMTYDVSDIKEKNLTIDDNSTENATKNVFYQLIVYGTEIIIPNLGHFQEYNIEVLACQETNGSTKFCSSRALSTARTKPSPAADNINASTVSTVETKNGSQEVFVRWKSPEVPNGVIITFQIEYKKISTADVEPTRICFTHKKYRKLGGYLFQRLDAGNYSYRIRATSLAGNGSFTPYFYFQVPQTDQGPQIPEAVIAAAVIGVLLVIIITIIVVWFVAKSKFARDPDVTTISMNPGYVPSADVYLPDDWEVDRDKIKLIRELGQGSFGMVYEGIAKDIGIKPFGEIKVAVKTVNDSAGWHDRMMFLKEASIMKSFSCHHVVKLLGVVSKGQPALVVMELMAQGDLKNFLRQHRPDEEENAGRLPPTLKEILMMSGEIADGMAYLADKKFVHRDLAARNCMVAEDKTVKIGDFGMTRDIYETDYYRKGGKGLLPVRWMAPESLKDGIFTTMSDVWSYGVVLWEMATLAAQPYQGLSNEEVLKYVADGRIMEKPDGCPDKLYEMMCQCWRYRYKKRPTFKEIIEMLVPDLEPKFKHLSYFFSDENKTEAPPDYKDIVGAEEPGDDLEDIEYSEQSDDELDVSDESRIPFMASHQSQNLNSVEMQRSPSRHNRDPSNTSPCECVLLEEMPNGHRNSTCSSPNSGVGYSDGSKGSSKSSNSSYTQINGIANGHIHMRLPRTTPC